MKPTTPNDILNIIKKLKSTNSTGYDDISTNVLKYVSTKLAPILSHIINLCISHGVFPEKLKFTVIKLIFKKGDRNEMSCYRPIALVPILSKVFEKVIHENIYNYFEAHNLLANEQIGFRKGKRINMAIFKFLRNIMVELDKKNYSCALYMDLTKAFDYVDHNTLLNKLYAYGIRGNVYDLIKSYLSNRKQSTQITRLNYSNKKLTTYESNYKNNNFGVPQGSVLGPLLFIIYINDLPGVTPNNTVLFVDDSTIMFTGRDKGQMEIEINNSLNNIVKWLISNNLKINLSKTDRKSVV